MSSWVFSTSIFVSWRLSWPFRSSCSSPSSPNPSHDIQILSGRNSSSRALRDFVGKVKDRRSHSIPENPRLTTAVGEREALCLPESRGLETPRLKTFRESVSGAAFTVLPTDWTLVPSFATDSRGVGGARHHEHMARMD